MDTQAAIIIFAIALVLLVIALIKIGLKIENSKDKSNQEFANLNTEQLIIKHLSQINNNTKNTHFWVKFWSILSIVGLVLYLISLFIR
ncbi:MAG: hypothetical protein MJZ71_03440 [Bacteroidales bacterium]|nr:hypothetical protein [Bacteroidales bacterium]